MKKLLIILFTFLLFFTSCEKEDRPPKPYFFIGEWTTHFSGRSNGIDSGWFLSFEVTDVIENIIIRDTFYLSYISDGIVNCLSHFDGFGMFYDFEDSTLYIDLSVNGVDHHVFDGKYFKGLNKFVGNSYYYNSNWPIDLWSENDSTYKGLMNCN